MFSYRYVTVLTTVTYYERHLPHWQPADKDVFVTWRLHGSLPPDAKILASSDRSPTAGERFRAFDQTLDRAGAGPLWLKDPRIAECLVAALHSSQEQELFRLHAYVVMANHIHVLLGPVRSLTQITHAVKGATARDANKILGRTGTRFWQDESFDRWIRNPSEWNRVRAYIEHNPVTAGLVKNPKDWPWSSASK
jgi:REP element-mobilizing transposase RayT